VMGKSISYISGRHRFLADAHGVCLFPFAHLSKLKDFLAQLCDSQLMIHPSDGSVKPPFYWTVKLFTWKSSS
jgi:hypothetical protein